MAADYFRRLRTEAQTFYGGLSQGRKILLGAVLLGVVVLLVFMVTWTQQPRWSTLYTDLSTRDAGQITQYLKDNDVPYQVNTIGQGAVVQVPEDQVHELRLQMAAEDLPREGGVMGYELFDRDNSMGMTNRVFDLNYQRALSGELARTIMQMDAVEKARVHLAIPRKQVFSALQDPPGASITLRLRPLAQLNESQVKGISKLVASSVPGLTQKNITITDATGKLLFDETLADDSGTTGQLNQKQLAYQRSTEQEIRQNIERILSRVVGNGQVSVQVKARMNFDQEQTISKRFEPNANPDGNNNRVLRSEKEVVEAGQGTEPVVGGAPGVTSNTPAYREQVTESDASYNRRDTTRNYEVSETQLTRVKEPGDIERLTVSVAINSLSPAINAPEGLDPGDPQLQRLRNLAVGAAGLDTQRGDTIAIHALPFENSEQLQAQEALARLDQQDFWWQIVQGALLLIVLGVLAFGFWSYLRRRPIEGEAVEEEEPGYPSLEAPTLDPMLTQAVHKRQQTVSSLTEMAEKEPAQMAQLLRVWLQEDT